jgi:hypothetical protein
MSALSRSATSVRSGRYLGICGVRLEGVDTSRPSTVPFPDDTAATVGGASSRSPRSTPDAPPKPPRPAAPQKLNPTTTPAATRSTGGQPTATPRNKGTPAMAAPSTGRTRGSSRADPPLYAPTRSTTEHDRRARPFGGTPPGMLRCPLSASHALFDTGGSGELLAGYGWQSISWLRASGPVARCQSSRQRV